MTSGSCQKLDFEVEFAAIIGQGSEMGKAIDVDQAEYYIFGFVLLNDWSARDFQQTEPAGPFTCKNFATQISPWIVPFEALEPFRVPPTKAGVSRHRVLLLCFTNLEQRPMLDYLTQKEINSAYEIPLRATLEGEYASGIQMYRLTHTPAVGSQKYQVAECNTKFVVFSLAQMIAHHTRGGCPLRPGDILATGTMSGPTRPEEGCFLELSRYGTDPYEMLAIEEPSKDRIHRTFLEDGDVIEFTAQVRASGESHNIGFGVCRGRVLPSN